MKHLKLVLTGLLVSSAAWARAPDFVWRRGAFSQPIAPSASGSGLLGIKEGAQCYVLRNSGGLLLKTFLASQFSCEQAVPSSDGRLVALGLLTVGHTAAIRVYETAGWTQVVEIIIPLLSSMPVFSPDSRLLAFSALGMTNVYDVGTWSLRATLAGSGPISISPDSQLAALRSDSNSIRIYRLEDGAEVTRPSGYGAFNHYLLGNDWIALANNDGIRIETIADPPQIIATLAAPRIQPLAISPDARWLAGIFDGVQTGATLQLWDTTSFSSVSAWPIGSPFSAIAGVAFPSNVSIVSVTYTADTSQIHSWSVPDGHFLESLNAGTGQYTPLVFSPDGSVVVGGFGATGNIRAWRSSDGLPLQTIAGSDRLVSLAFTNDGQYLVGGGERLKVWSWPDGNPLQSVSETTLEVAVSSRAVVAQRTQNEIRLRSLPDLTLVRTISQSGPMAFSPDGSLIIVGADLFAVETGVSVQSFRLSPFFVAAFSPDGTNVILSEAPYYIGRGYMDRFDVASGDLLARFGFLGGSPYPGGANSLSFSPDGSRLAQFSFVPLRYRSEVRLRIWDGYGLLYEDYRDDLGVGGVSQLRYSPDGRSLAVTGHPSGPTRTSVFGIAADPCADGACASRILPVSQLNDEFQEDRPNPGLWDVYASGGMVSTGTNGLTLRPDPGSVDTALIVSSKRLFSLLNSSATVQVPEVVGSGNVNTMFMLQVDWNNSIQWWYENGVWYAISYVNGVRNVHAELSGGAGYTLQIRENEGTVYWKTCNYDLCTTRATTPTSSLFPLGAVRLLFTAATFGTGSPAPGQARYRSLNPPPTY